MTVLDASVLISFFGDDVHTRIASRLLTRSSGTRMMHPVTFAEVLTGPARIGVEQDFSEAVQAIGVETTIPDASEPLLVARIRARTGLKVPDCYPLATALVRQSSLATFDVRLARAARGAGIDVIDG